MRKLIVVVMAAAAILTAVLHAKQAQAQTNYPNVAGMTAFTQAANYMSLPGYLRYRYFLDSGRWITREEAERAVESQGAA
jgi:hypothetical protein